MRIDFDTYLRNMKLNGFWRTNLEIIAFSDMMRLNISIYLSLEQNVPEVKINYLHNTGVINFYF